MGTICTAVTLYGVAFCFSQIDTGLFFNSPMEPKTSYLISSNHLRKPIYWAALQLRRLLPNLFLTTTMQNLNSYSLMTVFAQNLPSGASLSSGEASCICELARCSYNQTVLTGHKTPSYLLISASHIAVCSRLKHFPQYQSWMGLQLLWGECWQSKAYSHLLWQIQCKPDNFHPLLQLMYAQHMQT